MPSSSFVLKLLLTISILSVVITFAYIFVLWGTEPSSNPKDIFVTNVTDRSATITWVTDEETKGVVVVNSNGYFNPGVFATFGANASYDDRDVTRLELEMANESGNNSDESSAPSVLKGLLNPRLLQRYKVHHVTISNLDPDKTYYFAVGNGYSFDESEQNTFKTFSELDALLLPDPAYGLVKRPEGSMSKLVSVNDALVYLTAQSEDGSKISNTLSTVVSSSGSWYIDLSSARSNEGDLFWTTLSTLELDRAKEKIEVYSGDYGEMTRLVSTLADSPAYPFVLNRVDDVTLPENSVSGSSDLCVGAETEGLPCWINYEQMDPYMKGEDCTYECTGKGYCNAQGLCENQWTPGSVCRKLEPTCGDACLIGVQCYEGQTCTDGSPTDCCTGTCEWVYQESGGTSNGVPLVSSSIGTASSLYSNVKDQTAQALGLFDEMVTPVSAGNCSCNCGGTQGSFTSVYCGKTGTTSQQTFEDGCYEIIEHCNAEGLNGGSTCNTNHTYFEKGRKLSSSACDGTPAPGGSGTPSQNPATSSGSSPCYCERQDAQGNWINCHFNESAVQQAMTECQRKANETGVSQQLWCSSWSAGSSAASTLYSRAVQSSNTTILGNDNVLGEQNAPREPSRNPITLHDGCEGVENCNNGCCTPDKPPAEPEKKCCEIPAATQNSFSPTYQMLNPDDCKRITGAKVLDSVCPNNPALPPNQPSDPEVCCVSSSNDRSQAKVMKQSECSRITGSSAQSSSFCSEVHCCSYLNQSSTESRRLSISECLVKTNGHIVDESQCNNPSQGNPGNSDLPRLICCITEARDDGTVLRKEKRSPVDCVSSNQREESFCDTGIGDVVDASITLGELCLFPLGCRCLDDESGINGYVPVGQVCSLDKDSCSDPANNGKTCAYNRLGVNGVCYGGDCVLPVPVGTPYTTKVESIAQKLSGALEKLLSPINAQENEDAVVQGDIFLVPSMGIYTIKLGDEYLAEGVKVAVGEDVPLLAYVDRNGTFGFQYGEDEILDASVYRIGLEKTASVSQYSIKPGFNFVSFPMVIDGIDGVVTSTSLLKYLNEQYGSIFYSIGTYDSGQWKINGSRNGISYGSSEFQIVPGKGYVLKAKQAVTLELIGKEVKNPIPVSLMEGWNFMSVHGSLQTYTASSLLDSIDEVEGMDADNVSRWMSDRSRYDGLQKELDTQGEMQEYGFDFPLSPLDAYFVRVSDGSGDWTPDSK